MADITILLPLMNASEIGEPFVLSLLYEATSNFEVIVVNNSTDQGEKERWKFKLDRHFPELGEHSIHYYEPEQNLGLMATLQYAYERMNSDILVWVHTDVDMYATGWDQKIIEKMQESDCGMVGVCGSTGINDVGDRVNLWASLVNYHGHAERVPRNGEKQVVILDGALMAMKREMIGKMGGFDQYYTTGIYDYDISMQSHLAGYKNWVLDLPCFHLSGLSMNNQSYIQWLREKHPESERTRDKDNAYLDKMRNSYEYFMNKYKSNLPINLL